MGKKKKNARKTKKRIQRKRNTFIGLLKNGVRHHLGKLIMGGAVTTLLTAVVLFIWHAYWQPSVFHVYVEELETRDFFAFNDIDKGQMPLCRDDWEENALLKLSVANENQATVDVRNIVVNVVSYRSLDGLVGEVVYGGAVINEAILWECEISSEEREYESVLAGKGQEDSKYITEANYVSIPPNDTGKFHVKIQPDTPGVYKIGATVEYVYKGRLAKKEMENKEFIFDPQNEL